MLREDAQEMDAPRRTAKDERSARMRTPAEKKKRKTEGKSYMKVIFLDVDGVLNNRYTAARSPGGYRGVSDELIRNVRKIVEETGARIVLSSDWRLIREDPERGKDYKYLARKLLFTGRIRIFGHTDDISWSKRGQEIRTYLDHHPQITEYVVLDDNPFRDFGPCGLKDHLILTDPNKGLTQKDVQRAICILKRESSGACL